MSNYIIQNGELYHYGVPGMKWGVRKAKYMAKAEAYRKASLNTKNEAKSAKLNVKADKIQRQAESLDTNKGKAVYIAKQSAKVGAVAVAATLAAGFASKTLYKIGEYSGLSEGFNEGLKQGVKQGRHEVDLVYKLRKGKSIAEKFKMSSIDAFVNYGLFDR